jgi:sulfate adenylyltransferase
MLSLEETRALAETLAELPSVTIGPREILDLNLIAAGAFSPLAGYMTASDYHSVVETMHLANGLAWSLPITLAVSTEQAAPLREGTTVVLRDPQANPKAILELQERYTVDRAREARLVYRTEDESHPGVRALYDQGEVLLGGPISVLSPLVLGPFPMYPSSPSAARAEFERRGWETVVGFQTRNPVHRAHEFIQKCAMEIVDGLYLHPLVGETKDDDIPAPVRMRCYQTLLEHYYPSDNVVLGTFPARMRYAGPREAIFHALVRKNYGCTHFIVGRDHAGVGSYYGPYDAQKIFLEFTPHELGITPLFFENTFYCRRCASMASMKTCPHAETDHIVLSGTRVRAMLRSGEVPPPEFSRPEVASVLVEALQGASD